MANDRLPLERGCGNGDDVIVSGVRPVDQGELVVPEAFGVALCLALLELHGAVPPENSGKQLADKEQDEPGMNEQDARLSPGEPEAIGMREEEVDEQGAPDEIPPRENGHRQARSGHGPHHEEAPKILLLNLPNADVNLVKRRRKNEHHRGDEQGRREAQRDKEVAESN